MPKVLTSPIARFPGTILLKDPLTYPDLLAWTESMANARLVVAQAKKKADSEGVQEIAASGGAKSDMMLIPGIVACVAEWHLGNFPEKPTVENWPATPRMSMIELITWLAGGISDLMGEDEAVPPA